MESTATQAIASLVAGRDSAWAWENYKATVKALCRVRDARSLVEIGGGRAPLLSEPEIRDLGVRYTCNDISPRELARAPDYVEKRCFDVCAPVAIRDEYDLAFSKMVMEHVHDPQGAYRTIHGILKPGGVYFSFHPVLYSPVFVVNKMLPERLSRAIVRRLNDRRTDDDMPKFPAYYRWCTARQALEKRMRAIGFSQTLLFPFYGTEYFDRLPLLRDVDAAMHRYARDHDVRSLASYVYLVLIK